MSWEVRQELADAYAAVWADWEDSVLAESWAKTVADGLEGEPPPVG